MASIYKHKDQNTIKSYILVIFFTLIVCSFGFLVSYYLQSYFFLFLAVAIASVSVVTSVFSSHKMVLRIAKAKEANREKHIDLIRMIENLSITAGLPAPKLYIIEDEAPNAFATGKNPKHSVIAVTTGLIKILDKNEMEGVLAHELAHIGNRDVLFMAIVFGLAGVIAILADIAFRFLIFGGGRGGDNKASVVMLIIGVIVVSILASVSAAIIKASVSQKREYVADATACLLTRYPEGLCNALRKISSSHTVLKHKTHGSAFFFINDPFLNVEKKKKASLFNRLFSTHPPIEKRIEAMSI